MKTLKILPQLVAVFAIYAFVNTAGATAAFCPDDIGNNPPLDNNVNPSIGCQIGTSNNPKLGDDPIDYQVNQDMMFGFDDWVFAEKAFDDDEDVDISLTVVGDTISGLWSIDDIWNSMGISSLMLVFKGGNGEPDHYVGYLITPGATTGDYLTPFINAGSGNPKDISHISAYFRTGPFPPNVLPVSEPGSIVLIGLGLVAIFRLRKRADR